jgi:predicted peroxiredoxin
MSTIFMKSSWGSNNPTNAEMVFGHGNALASSGHDVRIFLRGEAVTLKSEIFSLFIS